MTGLSTAFLKALGFVLVLTMMTGLFAGCSSGNSDTPEGTSGSPDGDELISALEDDRLTDEERESISKQLLKNCTFYQGRVTVYEDQKWTSRGTDGSSGYGDTTLSTDEILVYNPDTKKTYIIVRYMSCSGWHRITVNDLHGDFLQYADVIHSGELYEYYGTGFIWKKNLESSVASESLISRYTLNFAANPVRMDNERSVIYTYPLPRLIDWVTYASIAGTDRRGGIRMWPPEESGKNTDLDLVPSLSDINDTNPYNSSESWVYEATDRLWTPSGTFSYDYYKISYEDAMSEIERLAQEASDAGAFGAMAKDQPPAWQETASLADELSGVASAIEGLNDISNLVLPQDIRDALEARNTADSLANEKIVHNFVSDMSPAATSNSGGEPEPASTRSLEGVVIETSDESDAGIQQKNLKGNFSTVKPYLTDLYRKYLSITDKMQQILTQIRESSNDGNFSVETISGLLDEFRGQVQAAVKLNETTEIILADAWVVLYDLNAMGDIDNEARYGELNRLFSLWNDTFETLENTSIDIMQGVELPAGYPVHIVPVMQGAIIAISQKIPGEDGEQDGFTITLKTDTSTVETALFYENLLKNEEDFNSFSFSGMTTLSGVKNGYEFGVMIMPNNLGGSQQTAVQITITPLE